KNVIKVKTVTAYKVGGISINSYAVEQWFQKGVGLIRYIDYAKTPFTTPSDVLDITRSKVY
ncbi:MAG: hypothetical protein ABI813_15535, partial [Bacteroidota bacterium]